MASVAATEVKVRWEALLRQVRRGQTLIITEAGEPVAELRPLRSATGNAGVDETEAEAAAWERLYQSGAASRPTGEAQIPKPVRVGGRCLAEAVREDRDESY